MKFRLKLINFRNLNSGLLTFFDFSIYQSSNHHDPHIFLKFCIYFCLFLSIKINNKFFITLSNKPLRLLNNSFINYLITYTFSLSSIGSPVLNTASVIIKGKTEAVK